MPDYFNEVEIMETFRAAAEVQCCTSFARRTALSPNNSYLRNHYLCISISLPSFYLLKLPLKSGKRCCSKEEKKGDLVMLGRGGGRNPLFFSRVVRSNPVNERSEAISLNSVNACIPTYRD